MKVEEKDLILQLQQRFALYEDMKAYKELYELLYNPLFKFSFSFVKNKEAAEEIISDVFIKLWLIKTELTSIDNLKVYLYTITKNFSLNYITKNYKNAVVSLEDVDTTALFNFSNPESTFISSEIVKKVNEAINQLPSQCKVVFYLVKECDLKYKEVASVLNISVNTVRNQVANATKKIADSLPVNLKLSFTSLSRFSES
jgi:RNA polymerase sigma-70 factor (family 1)